MKKIMSIDQSTSKSGYAIFSNNQLAAWGIIRPSKKIDDSNLKSMFVKIVKKIQEETPNIVLIEDVYMKHGKTFNVQTHKTLSQLQGMLIAYFMLNQIEYEIIHPQSWKNKVVGKKKISKEDTQSFLTKKYSRDFKEDEADAICIGLYYITA
jgi:Holliday junction resolvasome RuvABC endonuclease subunit